MKKLKSRYNILLFFIMFVIVGLTVSGFVVPINNDTMAEETAVSINELDNEIDIEDDQPDEESLEQLAEKNKHYYTAVSVQNYVLNSIKQCKGYTSTINGSLPLGSFIGTQLLGAKKQVNNRTNESMVQVYAVKLGMIGYDISRRYYSTPDKVYEKQSTYQNKQFFFGDEYIEYDKNTFIETWGLHPSNMFIQLNGDYIKERSYIRNIDGYTLKLTTDTMSMTADMFKFCFGMFGTAKNGTPEPKSENMYFTIVIDFYGNIKSIKIVSTFSCDLKCINVPATIVETLTLTETYENYNKNISIKPFAGINN